jgi:hypothetical protein
MARCSQERLLSLMIPERPKMNMSMEDENSTKFVGNSLYVSCKYE